MSTCGSLDFLTQMTLKTWNPAHPERPEHPEHPELAWTHKVPLVSFVSVHDVDALWSATRASSSARIRVRLISNSEQRFIHKLLATSHSATATEEKESLAPCRIDGLTLLVRPH
jgi:hypothetical protein